MKKKFLVGLAPLLAIAAFAMAPVTAQAAPHYWINGAKVKEGAAFVKTAIAWGNITLTGTAGSILGAHITCHNAAGGTLENPSGGGAGGGLVQQFAPFGCEQEKICPAKATGVAVNPELLPWHNVLTEETVGTIRQETLDPKVDIVCFEAGITIAELRFKVEPPEKGQRPKSVEGTSALHPGVLEFDAGSGELTLEGSGGLAKGKTEGAGKLLGYNSQELLEVHTP
jgi:hypothetical protein